MTKGQAEAKISEIMSKFEIEFMGRGPKKIKTTILQDMIIIRLQGFLSQSEQILAENSQGVELLKKVRSALFESSTDYLIDLIQSAIPCKITSIHSDVSTKTGEKVIVMITNDSIEALF